MTVVRALGDTAIAILAETVSASSKTGPTRWSLPGLFTVGFLGVTAGVQMSDRGLQSVLLSAIQTSFGVSDATIGALLGWKLRQDAEREKWGEAWEDAGYVFTREDGTPVKPDYATRLFEKLRKQAGLPKITLHGARHEHASLWIAGGGDVTLLSKRLGHSTSRITADLYLSRVGDADRAQAERVAAMIPRGPSHTVHTQDA